MVLTFKSTGLETLIVIDREPDGRQRVGRATQSAHNPRMWDIRIEHPSGSVTPATYHGTKYEAGIAISDLMNRSENEYRQERARGDRPRQSDYSGSRQADRSVQVNDQGAFVNAPIRRFR
jgi:hypothetical protein